MIDTRELRTAFGRFATGVTVVTCLNRDGEPHGATVNAFTAVSLDPPLAQVTLGRGSKASDFLTDTPFAINVLTAEQIDVAWHFAGRPAAAAPRWIDGPEAPILEGTAATISCAPWRTYDGGDHLIVIGEVTDIRMRDGEPLLFYGGKFRHLRAEAGVPGPHWSGSIDCPDLGWFDASASFTPLPEEAHRTAS